MGRIFGTGGSGRIFSSGGSGGASYSTEELLQMAEQKGYAPKEKVGALTRVGNVLQSFEPGGELATFFRTRKDVGTAAKKAGKQYVSEVGRGLGSAFGFLDEWTDPNQLAAEREGYSEALGAAGWKPKDKWGKLAKGGVGLAGDIFLDPGNLALAGLFKLGGKAVSGVAKVGAKGLAKFDAGEAALKTISKAADVGADVFKPGYKASRVAPEITSWFKGIARKMNVGDKEVIEVMNTFIKKHGVEAINKAPYELGEAGAKNLQEISPSVFKKLSPETQELIKLIRKKTAGEVGAGLRKTTIQDYIPRKVIKEPLEAGAPKAGKFEATIGGAGKQRTYETIQAGEEAGIKYAPAVETVTRRLATSQRAIKAKGAINELITGTIKDASGQSIIKPLKKGQELLQDHISIIVRKNGIKIGDKTLGFYKTVGEKGQKLIGVTTRTAKFQMHKDVADYLLKADKVFGNEKAVNATLRIYDRVLNLWKGSVTSYFPAFHIRNAMGNIFNNYLAGVYNPNSYRLAAEIQKGSGKLPSKFRKIFPGAETYEEAHKVMAELGVTGHGQFAIDVGRGLELDPAKVVTKKKLAKTLGVGRQAGTAIENNARIAHFVDKVRGGSSIQEATKSVNKFLFDYSDLTRIETDVIKRIIPFYTFTRKNVPLQIEQVFKQPMKYKAVFDAMDALKRGDLTAEEKKYLPDYIRHRFSISLGKSETGSLQILSSLGLPYEDISKLDRPMREAINMVFPLVKFIPELSSKHSFFYESDIRDTKAYNQTTKAIGDIPGLKQYLKAKEMTSKDGHVYYRVNPKRMYYLKTIIGRFVSTGERLTDERKDKVLRAFNALTGLQIYTPNIEREKEKQLMEMLRELGLTRIFHKEYVPKDIKKELME